ncbi:MAG: hypothetical protein A2259_04915 [Candidatus Moranbacteria bacterium RIFOXYA2_FULL_43_15]|nr:MAG: hypothetical protein A2259_04915 [Candidatus Moranbacteria bacterium RIFOXYA2_FULL_43_15]
MITAAITNINIVLPIPPPLFRMIASSAIVFFYFIDKPAKTRQTDNKLFYDLFRVAFYNSILTYTFLLSILLEFE